MDDKRKDHVDPKGPKQKNICKQLQTITCLPMMWKIREEMYYSLKSRGLFSVEQKGCHRGSRGTTGLLYIDHHILNESTTRRKNLAMAWIDFKKAYAMIPQYWIINCLKMYKISHEVIKNFIDKTMKTWRVELTAGGRRLAEIKIQRGIFLDALSPLLLIIAMMPLIHLLRKCTTGYKHLQCITKVNTPLIFLQIFKYISSWDNTDKMTLWHNEK